MKRYSVSLDVWCPEGFDEQLVKLLDLDFHSDVRRGDVLYRLEPENADGTDLALMVRDLASLFNKDLVSDIIHSCKEARAILNIAVYFGLDNAAVKIPKELLPKFSGWADISVSYYCCDG